MVALRDAPGSGHTDDEVSSMAFLLLIAGHTAPASFLADGIITALTEPGMWRRLASGADAAAKVVDDLLRRVVALPRTIPRVTAEPVTVGGVVIPAGAVVLVDLAAVSRDPAASGQGHLGFGYGRHYCVGAALAKVMAAVAFGALASRLPGLRLTVRPEAIPRNDSLLNTGPVRVPVRW